jgi:hypothetical protein
MYIIIYIYIYSPPDKYCSPPARMLIVTDLKDNWQSHPTFTKKKHPPETHGFRRGFTTCSRHNGAFNIRGRDLSLPICVSMGTSKSADSSFSRKNLPIWSKKYHNWLVKQCHVYQPPVITIFIGGMSTIPIMVRIPPIKMLTGGW